MTPVPPGNYYNNKSCNYTPITQTSTVPCKSTAINRAYSRLLHRGTQDRRGDISLGSQVIRPETLARTSMMHFRLYSGLYFHIRRPSTPSLSGSECHSLVTAKTAIIPVILTQNLRSFRCPRYVTQPLPAKHKNNLLCRCYADNRELNTITSIERTIWQQSK